MSPSLVTTTGDTVGGGVAFLSIDYEQLPRDTATTASLSLFHQLNSAPYTPAGQSILLSRESDACSVGHCVMAKRLKVDDWLLLDDKNVVKVPLFNS